MNIRVTILLCFIAYTIFGCATLTDKAAKVQVHNQLSNLLDDCKKLGPVTATEKYLIDQDLAIETAEIKLRENAADMGGDTVAILNRDILLTKITIQGIAFKCY